MWPVVLAGKPPPSPTVIRMTDRCKNITLPQTSFAGGNEQWQVWLAQQANISWTVRYLWFIHTGQDRSQDCYRDEIKSVVPCGTRMHSSRMRTARSSSRLGRLHQAPPTRTRPPGPGTPQTMQPPQDQAPPTPAPPGTKHPPCGQTHTCKHITLPQTSFAGGHYSHWQSLVQDRDPIHSFLLSVPFPALVRYPFPCNATTTLWFIYTVRRWDRYK